LDLQGVRLRGGKVVDVLLIGAALALAVGAIASRRDTSLRASQDDWLLLLDSARTFGHARAPHTLLEFVDYQCPQCATVNGVVSAVLSEHTGRLRLAVRHFPLVPLSDTAAAVVECSARQGRFEAMHAALLENRALVLRRAWDSLATLAAIDDRGQLD
jgi:protein-disulfide isomerase